MTALLSGPGTHRSITATALAASNSAAGGCDCSPAGIVQLDRLSFPSLDEPMLIQLRLEQRRKTQERDRWIGRAIGAGVSLAVGCSDGFALADLTGTFLGGAVGGMAADGLSQLSDGELEALGLRWAVAPESYLFHQRRHGQPLHRVLLMALTRQGSLRTTCGVRFSDGYLAFFDPSPFRCDLTPFDGTRRLSRKGAMPEVGTAGLTVGELACSDGRARPLEALHTDKGRLLAMALTTPHHSLY
ncbi:hypothetical protein [Vulcanococcus limneticus]|uniref:hypothetical protein n=1 Tax=Vulcanococcus limneticus TaxID=2170428 RepID=UPI00398BDA57